MAETELRAKALRFLELREAKAKKAKAEREQAEAKARSAAEKAVRRERAKAPLATSKEQALEAYVARMEAETADKRAAYAALTEEERKLVVPPPPIREVVRTLRDEAVHGTRTGALGPKSPRLVNLQIWALLWMCYRYDITRREAVARLQPDFGWLFTPLYCYATDEELDYFRWFSRVRWDVVVADLHSRGIGIDVPEGEEWCDTQARYTFTCLAGLGHSPWETLMSNVYHSEKGCRKCGNLRQGNCLRRKKGP